MTHYETFLSLQDKKKAVDYLLKHHSAILAEAKNYKCKKDYKYLVTFTVDPVKYKRDNLTQDWIEKYIVKLIKQDDNIYCGYYCKEHADSNVHWHVVVKCNKALKYSRFDYYKRTVGLVDISSSYVKTDEFSSKYLEKESKLIIIKGELTKKI